MMEISDELEARLREEYWDCLDLEGRGDLTDFGKGMLCVLEWIFIE